MNRRYRSPHNNQTAIAGGRECRDGTLDPRRVPHTDRANLHPERRRRDLYDAELGGASRYRGIPKNRHAGDFWRDLLQKLQPLRSDTIFAHHESGGVTTRSREAFDEAGGDRVADDREYHWDDTGRLQQRSNSRSTMRQDDIGRERGQFRRVSANFVGLAGGPARLNPRVAADTPAQQRQPLQERSDANLEFRIIRRSR